MKIVIQILVFSFITISSSSQDVMRILSFEIDEMDMSAKNQKVYDNNDDLCALIKVETNEVGFRWEIGSSYEILKSENKTGEIWLYVPQGVKIISIFHSDYEKVSKVLPTATKEGRVYRIKLQTPTKTNIEVLGEGSVIFSVNELGYDHLIDDNSRLISTTGQSKLSAGNHKVTIKKEGFNTLDTIVKVTSDILNKYSFKIYRPTGRLQIYSSPENAKVYIESKYVGGTPYSKLLTIGFYKFAIKKRGYVDIEKNIEIRENKIMPLDFKLVNYRKKLMPLKIAKTSSLLVFTASIIVGSGYGLMAKKKMKQYNTSTDNNEATELRSTLTKYNNNSIIGFSSAVIFSIPFVIYSRKVKKVKNKYGI